MNKYLLKRVICIVIIILFTGVLIISAENKRNAITKDAVEAFNCGDFLTTYSRGKITAIYGNSYLASDEKEKLLNEICIELGIKTQPVFTEYREDNKIISELKTEGEDWNFQIQFITIEKSAGYNVLYLEQYIIANINIDNSIDSVVYYKNRLEDIFMDKNFEVSSELNVCGEIKRILDEETKWKIAEKFIYGYNGKIIAKDIDLQNYAVYGYTSSVDEYILYGNSKVNLTLIIEEDTNNSITSVYMATPSLE